jgi:hypothetical protein
MISSMVAATIPTANAFGSPFRGDAMGRPPVCNSTPRRDWFAT